MRKIILLTLLFICNTINAQDISWEMKARGHNPNPKNELSKYFKKEISKKHLKKAVFQRGKNNIILSFNINNEKKPYRINIPVFGSLELRKEIKEAFKKYPLEKLNLESLDPKNRYSLQIITKKGKKNIFNCSTNIIVETPPICKNCEDLNNFEDLEKCLNIEVKKHFYKTFDTSQISENELNIYIKYKTNKKGEISILRRKKPLKYFEEIKNSLSSFPIIENKSTFNGTVNQPEYSLSIAYKKENDFVYEDSNHKFIAYSKPTTDNDFSKYLSEKLSEETINKANLNRINNSLVLNFELDRKWVPFNITSNSRSQGLETEIINAFKNYPIEKLNIANKEKFNRYNLQILSFTDSKTIIKTSNNISFLRAPVFPGCETSKSIKELRKCFSRGVQRHFAKKFDADLPNRLGLSSGRKKILIMFKINREGEIDNLLVKAPHVTIKNEVIKVMKQLPKVEPAVHIGKNVNIKYSIPFSLIIE